MYDTSSFNLGPSNAQRHVLAWHLVIFQVEGKVLPSRAGPGRAYFKRYQIYACSYLFIVAPHLRSIADRICKCVFCGSTVRCPHRLKCISDIIWKSNRWYRYLHVPTSQNVYPLAGFMGFMDENAEIMYSYFWDTRRPPWVTSQKLRRTSPEASGRPRARTGPWRRTCRCLLQKGKPGKK